MPFSLSIPFVNPYANPALHQYVAYLRELFAQVQQESTTDSAGRPASLPVSAAAQAQTARAEAYLQRITLLADLLEEHVLPDMWHMPDSLPLQDVCQLDALVPQDRNLPATFRGIKPAQSQPQQQGETSGGASHGCVPFSAAFAGREGREALGLRSRHRLLRDRRGPSSKNPQPGSSLSGSTLDDASRAIISTHKNLQEELSDQMLTLAGQMKANSLAMEEKVKSSNKALDATEESMERNVASLSRANQRASRLARQGFCTGLSTRRRASVLSARHRVARLRPASVEHGGALRRFRGGRRADLHALISVRTLMSASISVGALHVQLVGRDRRHSHAHGGSICRLPRPHQQHQQGLPPRCLEGVCHIGFTISHRLSRGSHCLHRRPCVHPHSACHGGQEALQQFAAVHHMANECGFRGDPGNESADSIRSSSSASAGLEETILLAGDAPSSAPLDQSQTKLKNKRRKNKHTRERTGRRKFAQALGNSNKQNAACSVSRYGASRHKHNAPLPRRVIQLVNALQAALSPRLSSKLPPKATLFALYVSHFLSRWTNRMWEFAVPLFLLDSSYIATSASSSYDTVTSGSSSSSAGSASLLLVALYGLSESLAMSLFSVPIGTWVDLCPRLPLAAFAISAQNAALFLAAIAVAALLYLADYLASPAAASPAGSELFAWVAGAAETGADVALVAAVCALGAAAALAELARGIAVERDWAVVIADWVCEQEGASKRGSGRQGEWDDRGQVEDERGGVVEVEVAFNESARHGKQGGREERGREEGQREQVQREERGEHQLQTHVGGKSGFSKAGEQEVVGSSHWDKAAHAEEVLAGQQQGQQQGQQEEQLEEQKEQEEQQGSEHRERVRARLNSTLRTIDLLCRLLAPALTGALMAAASSSPSASTTSPAASVRPELLPVSLPLAMAVWVLAAAAAELLLLALVHLQVPGLGGRRKEWGGGEEMGEGEGVGEEEREGEGGEEEEEEDEEAEEEEGREGGTGHGGDGRNGVGDVTSRLKTQVDDEEHVQRDKHEAGDTQILVPSAANPMPPASLTPSDSPAIPNITTITATRSSSRSSSSEPPLVPSVTQSSPSPVNPSSINGILSSLHHLRLLTTSWLTTLRSAWTIYLRQASLLPSLALALLYLTVLSFGSLMCAYLHSQGVPLGLLGSASGAAAVTGVLGATLFPSLCARLGPSRTAEASVWSQLTCLLPCVVAGLVLQSSGPIPAVLLMIGVVLSRAPLWVFDLSVLQMVQGAVVEEERGAVGGVQESLQQGMQLVVLVLAAVISRPRDFWVLTTVSGGAVTLAAVLVSVDRRARGLLSRLGRGVWQRKDTKLLEVDDMVRREAAADEV
ncbi:unnamed protein product [Closterium sp. Yama58-4]|nr:unnamed protein product [Closterium sp. Yama58-4]